MNTDKMRAGREMDALVAEKVMGWSDIMAYVLRAYVPEDDYYGKSHEGKLRVPDYSTDIAAAWGVFEKFQALGCPSDRYAEAYIAFTPSCGYRVGWQWHETEYDPSGGGDTAPLAICRAALKAVM